MSKAEKSTKAEAKPAAPAANVARDKNLELAVSSITKQFGEGSIMRLGDNANNPALTRKEAVTLIRGAGLVPAERQPNDLLEDVTT